MTKHHTSPKYPSPFDVPVRLPRIADLERMLRVSRRTVGSRLSRGAEEPRGNELPNMPNHKFSVTADREFALGDRGTLMASTTFSLTGERFNRIQNIAYDVLESHTRWDASLSWVSASERTSATFYVENLTDEIGIMELESNGWSDGHLQDATLTDPRFIGFVVRWQN